MKVPYECWKQQALHVIDISNIKLDTRLIDIKPTDSYSRLALSQVVGRRGYE